MGEAERRRAKLDKWIDGLSGQEKTIYNVCKTAFEEIIVGMRLEEGCYWPAPGLSDTRLS